MDVGIAHAAALVLRLGVPLRTSHLVVTSRRYPAQRLDVEVHDRTATRSIGGGTRLHVAFAVGATIVAAGAIASAVLVNAKATDLSVPTLDCISPSFLNSSWPAASRSRSW